MALEVKRPIYIPAARYFYPVLRSIFPWKRLFGRRQLSVKRSRSAAKLNRAPSVIPNRIPPLFRRKRALTPKTSHSLIAKRRRQAVLKPLTSSMKRIFWQGNKQGVIQPGRPGVPLLVRPSVFPVRAPGPAPASPVRAPGAGPASPVRAPGPAPAANAPVHNPAPASANQPQPRPIPRTVTEMVEHAHEAFKDVPAKDTSPIDKIFLEQLAKLRVSHRWTTATFEARATLDRVTSPESIAARAQWDAEHQARVAHFREAEVRKREESARKKREEEERKERIKAVRRNDPHLRALHPEDWSFRMRKRDEEIVSKLFKEAEEFRRKEEEERKRQFEKAERERQAWEREQKEREAAEARARAQAEAAAQARQQEREREAAEAAARARLRAAAEERARAEAAASAEARARAEAEAAAQARAQPAPEQHSLNDDMYHIWTIFEKKWAALRGEIDEHIPPLTFNMVPWPVFGEVLRAPDLSEAAMRSFILGPKRPGAPGRSAKEKVKAELLRYHPDKFNARVMQYVMEDEKEAVQEGVAKVICFLTSMLKDVGH